MLYQVEFASAAVRQLGKLSRDAQDRLRPVIDALAVNPRPFGVEKLRGAENLYRIREGDYRIIYEIQDRNLVVLVVRIGPRKDVYRIN